MWRLNSWCTLSWCQKQPEIAKTAWVTSSYDVVADFLLWVSRHRRIIKASVTFQACSSTPPPMRPMPPPAAGTQPLTLFHKCQQNSEYYTLSDPSNSFFSLISLGDRRCTALAGWIRVKLFITYLVPFNQLSLTLQASGNHRHQFEF